MSMQPVSDPSQRVINLGVAENGLCHDEMEEQLSAYRKELLADKSNFNYFQMEGIYPLRKAIAELLNSRICETIVRPCHEDSIVVGNGCGPVLEAMVSCVADEGDVILVPSPYYHAFAIDLCKRQHCKIVAVPVTREGDNYRFNLEDLETIYNEHSQQAKVRAFVYTNPHNPSARRSLANWSTSVWSDTSTLCRMRSML
eukprot:TRINITY_DN9768_c0_g1_i2.p1 TRINITY_DN9768_c0_g1~~TRINITY_DN9768_c0_g1_i2.p1  ORF type:complete len:232 (+),score=34.18 TRINITY_DN9768_c0_g1_i2:100-696(+)